MFAKLFGDDKNQILVKIDSSDVGSPEVRFYFEPKGLGVCSMAIGFSEDDAGWDKAEACFASMDEDKATRIVNEQIDLILNGG